MKKNNLLLRTDFRLGLYSLQFLSVCFADPKDPNPTLPIEIYFHSRKYHICESLQ